MRRLSSATDQLPSTRSLGAMVRTKRVAGYLHTLLGRIKSDRLRNVLSKAVCFLTSHPVDVATGRVPTDAVDYLDAEGGETEFDMFDLPDEFVAPGARMKTGRRSAGSRG